MRLNAACVMAVVSLCMAGLSSFAVAQGYPSKPVRVVLGFPPGGSTDIEARMYADMLTEAFGKPFVMDYRAGAGGTIAYGMVAKAPADGYTILPITSSFIFAPLLYENLPYDPIKDFTPISLVSKRSTVILLHPSVPAKNLQEYLAYARANPGALNWGTSGGGATYLAGAWLHNMSNTKVTFVHYKGAAPMFLDMMAGRVQVAVTTFSTGTGYIKSGKLRPLAVTGTVRTKIFPDIPTVAEQGLPEYDFSSVLGMGVLGPSRMPANVVTPLNAALAKIARDPAVAQKLEGDATQMVGNTSGEYRAILEREFARWAKLVKDTGIKLTE